MRVCHVARSRVRSLPPPLSLVVALFKPSRMAAQLNKKPIHQLPISPHAPIYHLTPDPLFPTPASLFALSSYKPPEGLGSNGPVALREGDPVPPSMLRRSRQIRGGGAFTYVSPLPLEFPYDIQDGEKQEKKVGKETQATAGTIEEALAGFEISPDVVVARDEKGKATVFSSQVRQSDRFPKPALLALSNKCLEEWLPQLEVGAEGSKEREQLVEILAGRSVLARQPDGGPGFAPWSLCYGGHQFGSWASQLGDGRAISLRELALRRWLTELGRPPRVPLTSLDSHSLHSYHCRGQGVHWFRAARAAAQGSRQDPLLSLRRRTRGPSLFGPRVPRR